MGIKVRPGPLRFHEPGGERAPDQGTPPPPLGPAALSTTAGTNRWGRPPGSEVWRRLTESPAPFVALRHRPRWSNRRAGRGPLPHMACRARGPWTSLFGSLPRKCSTKWRWVRRTAGALSWPILIVMRRDKACDCAATGIPLALRRKQPPPPPPYFIVPLFPFARYN